MSKPRKLIVISGLTAGGAERVATQMANYWAQSGHPVGVLTLSDVPDHFDLEPGVERLKRNIIWASNNPLQGIASNLQRRRIVREAMQSFAPDVVISLVDRTNVLVLAALVGSGIPVIASERVNPTAYSIGPALTFARRCLYPFATRVVVQTSDAAAWAYRLMRSTKVDVIPNGIGELPEPPPYASREKIVLGVGRLVGQKGFDILIKAFSALGPDWRLVILGEGPERKTLEQLVAEHGLCKRVDFPGVVTDLTAWLGRARIFALSSRFEGFPNALLEAMAMGCACIATDCPSGPSSMITQPEHGSLIPVEDVAALRTALTDLANNDDRSERMAARATYVRDVFSVENVMTRWDECVNASVKA